MTTSILWLVLALNLIALGAGAIVIRLARGLSGRARAGFEQAARAEHLRAQLEAELVQLRQKRHTHATIEMLEDLESVNLDIAEELNVLYPHLVFINQFYVWMRKRAEKQQHIIAAGRPGPYAYQPANTEDRPARPGAGVKLWTM